MNQLKKPTLKAFLTVCRTRVLQSSSFFVERYSFVLILMTGYEQQIDDFFRQ